MIDDKDFVKLKESRWNHGRSKSPDAVWWGNDPLAEAIAAIADASNYFDIACRYNEISPNTLTEVTENLYGLFLMANVASEGGSVLDRLKKLSWPESLNERGGCYDTDIRHDVRFYQSQKK